MSPYTLDQILGRADNKNASSDANINERPVGQGTPSYTEFREAHRYMGEVDVAPRQFDIRSPYGETVPRGGYAGQGYAPDGYAAPQQGYAAPQDYSRQGYAGQDYARPNYEPRGYDMNMRQDSAQGYYTPDYYRDAAVNQNAWQGQFYGSTASQEMGRMAELDGKLASVNGYSRTQENTEVHEEVQGKTKMKKRLNAKGAIILSLYLIVVAVVITLIGVNAGKINSGKAVVPASEVAAQISEQY